MQLHIAPATPEPQKRTALPNLLDLHELVRDHLPPVLVKLASFDDLKRRCEEIDLTMPRFREETPLVLRAEAFRRERLANPAPVPSSTQFLAKL